MLFGPSIRSAMSTATIQRVISEALFGGVFLTFAHAFTFVHQGELDDVPE